MDVITALKAMTLWPAWQHFEEDRKGSIETGKLADFVILSDDPTAVDPETLDRLKVLETIKEGRTVFALESAAASNRAAEANPALSRLLSALGEFGAGSATGPAAKAEAAAGAPGSQTCASDGMLTLTTAMLGGVASRQAH
jgi:hypothetical protein